MLKENTAALRELLSQAANLPEAGEFDITSVNNGDGTQTLKINKAGELGASSVSVDYNNPLSYLGANPKVVYEYTEHFTLADLNFDVNGNYSTAATLRAGNTQIINYENTSSDKDYVVWQSYTDRLYYNGDSGKPQEQAGCEDVLYTISTSYNGYTTSGRENTCNSLAMGGKYCLDKIGKIRRLGQGLRATWNSPTVTANMNPTNIVLKSANIVFSSHAWSLDAAAVPLLDINRSYIDIKYKLIETDRYNIANGVIIPHIKEIVGK